MKRLLLASLLLCFVVSSLPAQTPTLVTGTVKDVNGVPYSFAKVSASLTGIPPNVNATILVNGIPTAIGGQQNASADANGNFTMNLFCNTAGGGCSVISPSGTQWQFTVNETGTPPPLGTGPQTCSATVTITGASQSVSSSFSACPALSNSSGAGYPTTVVDATNPSFAGGVKHDVIIVNDATFNSSSTVTTSATDPVFFPSDVGKIIFGTNQTGGGTAFYLSTVILPQGTITTFNNSHSVTASTTATFTGTGALAWGTQDDTPAIQAASNAAQNANCSALQLPAGKMFVSTGITNTTATCATADWMSGQRIGITILGMGTEATYLVPLPSYTASVNLFSHVALARDFTVNGLGNSVVTGNPTIIILQGEANSIFQNVKLIGWGGNTSHMVAFQPGGTSSYILNSQCDGAGGTGINITSGFNSAWGLSCGDMAGPILQIGIAGIFDDHGSTYFDVGGGTAMISVQGNYSSDGAQWVNAPIVANSASMIQVFSGGVAHISKLNQAKQQSSGTNVNVFRVLNGGKLYLTDDYNMTCSASASCTGLQVDSGGIAYASNSTFTGTAASVNVAGTYNDMGGNTYSTAATFTAGGSIFGPNTLQGSCSGVATATSTLGLYGLAQTAALTCTSTVTTLGPVMQQSGTLLGVAVTATAAGVNASSGVVTVLKNGSATTITCTIGTGTACSDFAHSTAYVQGDVISVQFTTQAADTLAGVKASILRQ